MALQRGPQNRKLLVGLQTAEAFLGLQHCSCRPSQGHSCIAPAFDVAANLPQHGNQALDRVGATERAAQLLRQAQPDHGEHFIEPFEDRSRDARSIVIEPPRQVLKNTLGLLGGRAVPSLTPSSPLLSWSWRRPSRRRSRPRWPNSPAPRIATRSDREPVTCVPSADHKAGVSASRSAVADGRSELDHRRPWLELPRVPLRRALPWWLR